MLTTFIAFSLLSRGLGYWWAFVLVLVIGFAIGAATERVLIRPAARAVGAQPGHRHHRAAGRLRGPGRRDLRQRQPRVPCRLLAERPHGRPHDDRLLALRRLHPHRRARVDGRHAGALPLHRARAAHAGDRLLPRDRPAPRRAGGHPPHPRVGPGRHRRVAGRPPGRADELVRAVLHGPDPRLRLHGGGDRRPREPGGRPRRRADLGPVHLLRGRVPRLGARTARRAGPPHGRPHGPARGHLRPARRRGGSEVDPATIARSVRLPRQPLLRHLLVALVAGGGPLRRHAAAQLLRRLPGGRDRRRTSWPWSA